MTEEIQYRHYKLSVAFSLFLAAVVAVFLIINGKNSSSLIINQFNSSASDYFFTYFTYLGDGMMWIPVLFVVFLRRDYVIAVVAAIIISTLITQGLKHFVFPNDLRPIGTLKDRLHIIKGLEINTSNSFPSGHTGTAFTIATLLAFMIHRTFWTFFLPVVAFLVGYSRVYLGQHFVTDVLAGILVGILSSYLSLLVYKTFIKRKAATTT